MIIWTLFFIFSFWYPLWDVSHLSFQLHHLCLNELNFDTSLAEIYKALLCGKRLPKGQIKGLFIQGGLIHLTVVSGAHLLFLEKLWKKIPLPLFIKTHGLFGLLILYALASHFHPPVVRALFSFFLFRLSYFFKLFWNVNFITLLSGILCLVYKPEWSFSFSLQLSLLACFLYNMSESPFKKSFFIYLFIIPVINRWQFLHPFTVLINWSVTPFIGGLLFPLSFLSPFFPVLYTISDLLWTFVLQILKALKFLPSQSPFMQWYIPKEWIWFYIGFVYIILSVTHLLKKKFTLYPKSPTPF